MTNLNLTQMTNLPRSRERDNPNKTKKLFPIRTKVIEEKTPQNRDGTVCQIQPNYRCGNIGLMNKPYIRIPASEDFKYCGQNPLKLDWRNIPVRR